MDNNQALQPGTTLHHGSYRIERVLGQGGFGITYLAFDCGLDEYVAVKEFFPKMFCSRQDSQSITVSVTATEMVEGLKAKFIKEAKRLAKLKVKGIVSVRAAFEDNGTAYYVMDFVEGGNLNDLVKTRGPLPLSGALRYIGQVADALGAVHERKINHLDVKPANIMLDRESDEAVLIDFGLAKQYDEQGGQTSSTPTGLSHGYAPLEQYHQSGVRQFSPQADIYSLAATLYYLLSGEVPPHATDLVGEELEFPADIPAQLRPAIARGMAIKPKDRPASIAEFMAEVRAAAGSGAKPRPKTKPATQPKPQSRPNHDNDKTEMIARADQAATAYVQAPATAKPTPAAPQGKLQCEVSTTPLHLSLAIKYNGAKYYVAAQEWNKLPQSKKNAVQKLGVVVRNGNTAFILALNDSTDENLNWNEAMNRYGSVLPNKAQAEQMRNWSQEINAALKQFGGAEMLLYYWTSTERDSTEVWFYNLHFDSIKPSHKTNLGKVRAVYPLAVEDTGEKTPSKPWPWKWIAAVVALVIAAVVGGIWYNQIDNTTEDTDIQIDNTTEDTDIRLVLRDYSGAIQYRSPDVAIPASDEILGLLVRDENQEFMLALQDLSEEELTWQEAMDRFGSQLPTKAQAELLADKFEEINDILKRIGASPMDYWYWTSTEYNSAGAWYVNVDSGFVYDNYKAGTYRVRAVAPVPESSAK